MFSPVLSIVMQYGGPVLAGVLVALICKAYFATQIQKKIHEYEGDILKSHSKILELEAQNDKLQKTIKEAKRVFTKDFIFMN